jgi:hypothetical protein
MCCERSERTPDLTQCNHGSRQGSGCWGARSRTRGVGHRARCWVCSAVMLVGDRTGRCRPPGLPRSVALCTALRRTTHGRPLWRRSVRLLRAVPEAGSSGGGVQVPRTSYLNGTTRCGHAARCVCVQCRRAPAEHALAALLHVVPVELPQLVRDLPLRRPAVAAYTCAAVLSCSAVQAPCPA